MFSNFLEQMGSFIKLRTYTATKTARRISFYTMENQRFWRLFLGKGTYTATKAARWISFCSMDNQRIRQHHFGLADIFLFPFRAT